MCHAWHVTVEQPDFHLPHDDKIAWMIETHGFALEAVPARADVVPPIPGYTYTVGLTAATGFPEVVVMGLTPAASRGLIDLVADLVRGGVHLPLGVALVGVLEHDLRCILAPVNVSEWSPLFSTGCVWHRSDQFAMVQLLWPDRSGALPHEEAFAEHLRYAQPVIGDPSPSLPSSAEGV
jgi:hypothetical protein